MFQTLLKKNINIIFRKPFTFKNMIFSSFLEDKDKEKRVVIRSDRISIH